MPDADPNADNPYHAPTAAPLEPLFLSRRERASLEALRRDRSSPPTILSTILRGRMLVAWSIVALPMVIFCLLAAALIDESAQGVVTALVIGMFVGCVARDIGWIRRYALLWPLNERILDFDKIDALLEGRTV